MPYLIWLDEAGNETKRLHKGRGRPPAGFKRRDDGNWVLGGKKAPVSDSNEAQEAQGVQETPELPELPEPRRRVRIVTADKPLSIESVVRYCSRLDIERDDTGTVVLTSAIPCKDFFGLPEFAFNSIYGKVELDPNNGQLRVFSISTPEILSVIIENAVVKSGDNDANKASQSE